ncbi:hypothetical protein D9M72_285690 [compost metagenome]
MGVHLYASAGAARHGQHRLIGPLGCQSFFSFSASITRIPLGPRRYVSLYSSR